MLTPSEAARVLAANVASWNDDCGNRIVAVTVEPPPSMVESRHEGPLGPLYLVSARDLAYLAHHGVAPVPRCRVCGAEWDPARTLACPGCGTDVDDVDAVSPS